MTKYKCDECGYEFNYDNEVVRLDSNNEVVEIGEKYDSYSTQVCHDCHVGTTGIEFLERKIELMKKALEFYANPDTYAQMIYEENEGLGSMILDDEGSIAIKTLKEVEDID